MSFTDQKPRVATSEDLKLNWGGAAKGERFRCYLCGYKFQEGDTWRWVYAGHLRATNFLTCQKCDGEDVALRWKAISDEYHYSPKFWALRRRE